MWERLRTAMAVNWCAQRHEDGRMGPGVPDVSFVLLPVNHHETGWIELKQTDQKRKDRPIRHFTKAQEQWLLEQHRLGVPVFLLLYITSIATWLWFHGEAIGQIQRSSQEELSLIATHEGILATQTYEYLANRCYKNR